MLLHTGNSAKVNSHCIPFHAAMLTDPENFTVMIVDPSNDFNPVTATFSWTALDSVTFDGQNVTYTVIVTYNNENVSMVANGSVSHPNDTLDICNLPACANLTATLTAERGSETSNGTVRDFSTSEPNSEFMGFIQKMRKKGHFYLLHILCHNNYYVCLISQCVTVHRTLPDYPVGSLSNSSILHCVLCTSSVSICNFILASFSSPANNYHINNGLHSRLSNWQQHLSPLLMEHLSVLCCMVQEWRTDLRGRSGCSLHLDGTPTRDLYCQ